MRLKCNTFCRKRTLSPVEQACTLTLPLFIISLDDLLLPNHDFQVAHTSFIKFYQLFDISRTRTPVLGHHHYLGLPPPSINWPPIPPPPPGLVPSPSHSPITLGDPKVDSRMRTHTCAPDWGPIHPLPGRFLSTSGSHGWGAAIIPFCGGPMLQ